MAKKEIGTKEQQLRAMRESNTGSTGSGFDASTIRERIKAAMQKELEPLDIEISRQKEIRDAAEKAISDLERVRAQITGDTRSGDGQSSGTRVRRSRAELEQTAKAIRDFVASRKDGASRGEIRQAVPGAEKVQDLKGFVSEYGGGKIRSEGEKAATRYHAA